MRIGVVPLGQPLEQPAELQAIRSLRAGDPNGAPSAAPSASRGCSSSRLSQRRRATCSAPLLHRHSSASRCARSRAGRLRGERAAGSRDAARGGAIFRAGSAPSRKPASSSCGVASRHRPRARPQCQPRPCPRGVIICQSAASACSAAAREAVPSSRPRMSDNACFRRDASCREMLPHLPRQRWRVSCHLAVADGRRRRLVLVPVLWPSGRPRCRFMVCTAAPEAPLPRLSMRAISSSCSSCRGDDDVGAAGVSTLRSTGHRKKPAGDRPGQAQRLDVDEALPRITLAQAPSPAPAGVGGLRELREVQRDADREALVEVAHDWHEHRLCARKAAADLHLRDVLVRERQRIGSRRGQRGVDLPLAVHLARVAQPYFSDHLLAPARIAGDRSVALTAGLGRDEACVDQRPRQRDERRSSGSPGWRCAWRRAKRARCPGASSGRP